MHHTVTGLIAMQICNLCHGIIATPDKEKWHATHQAPCRRHPTVAELRWKSHLLSLQTTEFHTDSMITLNHGWTVELICSLPNVAFCGNPALPEGNSHKQYQRYKQCMYQSTMLSSQGLQDLQQRCVEATRQSLSSTQHISRASVTAAAKLMRL